MVPYAVTYMEAVSRPQHHDNHHKHPVPRALPKACYGFTSPALPGRHAVRKLIPVVHHKNGVSLINTLYGGGALKGKVINYLADVVRTWFIRDDVEFAIRIHFTDPIHEVFGRPNMTKLFVEAKPSN